MKLDIKNLNEVPQYFDDVFNEIYSNWGENNPKFWRSWIKSSMGKSDIPMTFVVLADGQFVGTFSLWRCDMQSRQDLTPWLGGIVVKKDKRGHGIGLFIQQEALGIIKTLGYKCAYLFTKLIGFYEKTGWQYVGEILNEKDEAERLYKIDLRGGSLKRDKKG
jgi:predicted N-acetyltransferase YhbS